jgi:tagatose 6-phosphate kinase
MESRSSSTAPATRSRGPSTSGRTPCTHAVHLNRSESAALLGVDDPARAARALAHRCGLAVVTAGAAGAFAATGGEAAHASCRVDDVNSAVGSGDCLMAGLAVAHDRGTDWRQALRLGVACGAANCLRPELGMLHRADVDRLLVGVFSADA